ncbi:hypothetical protein CGJ92_03215 [Vibrio parahaemolyticus]|nr:hypothetical protein CGJ92_05815 [Vibrio parahaemolyticus]TOC09561.1 hypothetical protein CGJ92_03215 [Vibrio parahaemolyticus]
MDINRLFEKNKGKEEEKYELIKRKSPSISARASNVAVSERFELSIASYHKLIIKIQTLKYIPTNCFVPVICTTQTPLLLCSLLALS